MHLNMYVPSNPAAPWLPAWEAPWGPRLQPVGDRQGVSVKLHLPRAYLVWAGRLVHAARVLVLLLGLGLVGHAVGLIHGGHVVAERDGLHGFVHSAAHGPPHLGGDCGALLSRWVLGLLQGGERNKDGDQRQRSVARVWKNSQAGICSPHCGSNGKLRHVHSDTALKGMNCQGADHLCLGKRKHANNYNVVNVGDSTCEQVTLSTFGWGGLPQAGSHRTASDPTVSDQGSQPRHLGQTFSAVAQPCALEGVYPHLWPRLLDARSTSLP